MSAIDSKTALALALAAALLARPALAADPARVDYRAETYGRASGTTPLPGIGLVLELVDGDTPSARLRLFGGVPGNPASIVIAQGRASAVDASGARALVAAPSSIVSGNFDWTGYFEVRLNDLPGRDAGGGPWYAQGVHTSAAEIDPARGPIFELSNGLEFFPEPEPGSAPFSLAELGVQLPEHQLQAMQDSDGLEAKLHTALNSAGDELVAKLEVEASVAIVALVNVGGSAELEAKITRREDGRYDVELGADLTAKAGVELAEGVEAKVGQGVGGTRIFRFHSVAGVARGLYGLALALRFPELQPARFLADRGAFDAALAFAERMHERRRAAELALAELERQVWTVVEGRLAVARQREAAARAAYLREKAEFDSCRLHTPASYIELALRYAGYRAAVAARTVADAASTAARAAVEAARQVADAARQEVARALDAVARVGRVVLAIGQTVGFAKDHYVGSELRFDTVGEAEAVLGIPGVKLANVGAGAEAELKVTNALRFEKATAQAPRTITICRTYESRGKVYAGYAFGGELEITQQLELVDAFEFGAGAPRWAEHGATLRRDTRISGVAGAIAYQSSGIGRTSELWIAQDELLADAGNLLTLLQDDGLAGAISGLGLAEVGFSIQDRRQDCVGFAAGASIAGYGGSIEGSLEWSDQGDRRVHSSSIHDAAIALSASLDG